MCCSKIGFPNTKLDFCSFVLLFQNIWRREQKLSKIQIVRKVTLGRRDFTVGIGLNINCQNRYTEKQVYRYTDYTDYTGLQIYRLYRLYRYSYTRNSRRFAPFFLALEGASRPSPKLIVNMFSFCTSKNKTKIIRGFSQKISWIFKIFKNLMKIEFWWRNIFEI